MGRSGRMGQKIVKQEMTAGVKLYHQSRQKQAISRWKHALARLRSAEDRFVTLGYLAQAYCETGEYGEMLSYSMMQIELANSQNDAYMKAEAYVNLSRAYERQADFSKALSYGKSSLEQHTSDPRTPGYAYLLIGLAHLGFSQYQASLQAFEQSMQVANRSKDRLLEVQICTGLGSLFLQLKDMNKALLFLRNGLALAQTAAGLEQTVRARHRCQLLWLLATVLSHTGALIDANQAAQECLRLAIDVANRAIEARALCCMASIGCQMAPPEDTATESWTRYDTAFEISTKLNDRLGQLIILGSMAKSVSEERRHDLGRCQCQAIQLNKKCLDLAKNVGCKYSMLKCHQRLEILYRQLSDEDSEEIARKAVTSLIQEMELFCNFCGQRYANLNESLQALKCSHIFHERSFPFISLYADDTCTFQLFAQSFESEGKQSVSEVSMQSDPNRRALLDQSLPGPLNCSAPITVTVHCHRCLAVCLSVCLSQTSQSTLFVYLYVLYVRTVCAPIGTILTCYVTCAGP